MHRSYEKACEQREQLKKQAENIEQSQKELEQRQRSLSDEISMRQKSLTTEKIMVATKSYALRRHIEYLEGCIETKKKRP